MNPKASLKSLKVKVRPIASRPGVSDQPGNCASADLRASADSRSVMLASRFHTSITLTPRGSLWIPAKNKAAERFQAKHALGLDPGVDAGSHQENASKNEPYPRPMAAHHGGNHDGDVTTVLQG